MQDFLKINENDKVVVALKTILAGETITVDVQGEKRQITALEEIPAGHKMAICDIPAGAEVIKYGYRIGNAKEDIPRLCQTGNLVQILSVEILPAEISLHKALGSIVTMVTEELQHCHIILNIIRLPVAVSL